MPSKPSPGLIILAATWLAATCLIFYVSPGADSIGGILAGFLLALVFTFPAAFLAGSLANLGHFLATRSRQAPNQSSRSTPSRFNSSASPQPVK